jgi:hypothetical protein
MIEVTALPGPRTMRAPGRAAGRPAARARRSSLVGRLIGPVATPVAMFVLTLALIVAHQGRLLELTFMPMGVAVSYYLYRRYPAHYLGTVCWLYFLTPEVRRFADFFNGTFNPTSIIMATPMIASGIAGLSLVLNYKSLGQRRALPLVMMLMALAYGYAIGIVQFGIMPATFTLLSWVQPIFIAWQIMLNWRIYPTYRRVLFKTFVWGTLLMGLYGIYQYVAPPPWVVFWMVQSGMDTSSGSPVPFGLRICSTMNSTGPFSVTIMVGLLISLAAPGKTKIFAGVAGIPALLFTAVRTSWGGLVIGLIYPLAMLDAKSRMKLIMAAVCFMGLCSPMLLFDQVTDPIVKRMATIGDLKNDNSFQARSGFYTGFSTFAEQSFAGHGLGSTGLGAKLASDPSQILMTVDSGVVEIVWVLGWPGSLLYFTALFSLVWRAFVASLARPNDRFAVSQVGVAITIFAIMVMIDTMLSAPGIFFMVGVLMPVIGVRYARHMQHLNALQKSACAQRSA